MQSHNPSSNNAPRLERILGFGLSALSLAATSAISFDFFSSGQLDVSVPQVIDQYSMYSSTIIGAFRPLQVSPFGNLRVIRLCASYRSLSQLATSFIGHLCQGIHRVPLKSLTTHIWFIKVSRCNMITLIILYQFVSTLISVRIVSI